MPEKPTLTQTFIDFEKELDIGSHPGREGKAEEEEEGREKEVGAGPSPCFISTKGIAQSATKLAPYGLQARQKRAGKGGKKNSKKASKSRAYLIEELTLPICHKELLDQSLTKAKEWLATHSDKLDLSIANFETCEKNLERLLYHCYHLHQYYRLSFCIPSQLLDDHFKKNYTILRKALEGIGYLVILRKHSQRQGRAAQYTLDLDLQKELHQLVLRPELECITHKLYVPKKRKKSRRRPGITIRQRMIVKHLELPKPDSQLTQQIPLVLQSLRSTYEQASSESEKLRCTQDIYTLARWSHSLTKAPSKRFTTQLARLTEEGGAAQLSKATRALLFDGYYDFDLNSAHACILLSLLKVFEMQVPDQLVQLVEDKETARGAAAQASGLTVSQVKACVNAILYGCETSTFEYSALNKEHDLNRDQFKQIGKHFKPLIKTVKDLGKVNNEMARNLKEFTNAIGQSLVPNPKEPGKLLHSLMAGIEQFAIANLFEQLTKSGYVISGYTYDGFLSPDDIPEEVLEQNMAPINQALEDFYGVPFSLSLHKERLQGIWPNL